MATQATQQPSRAWRGNRRAFLAASSLAATSVMITACTGDQPLPGATPQAPASTVTICGPCGGDEGGSAAP